MDVVGGGGSRGRNKGRFLVAGARRGGEESMVYVNPGTRRTTTLCMLSVFCEQMGMNHLITGDTHLKSEPALRRVIGDDVKDKVADRF